MPEYHKNCDICNGKGWQHKRDIFLKENGKIDFVLPKFQPCKYCQGTGQVEMTQEEIWQDEDCRRDDIADQMSDR